jgi:hypothetical protein
MAKEREIREYALLLAKTHGGDADKARRVDAELGTDAMAWLNEHGTHGFRLMRAEADAQGVMWLIMERVYEPALGSSLSGGGPNG